MTKILNKETFKSEVFDYTAHKSWIFEKNIPIILNFFATWCGPCHRFAPILEEISNQYEGRVYVMKVDIDKDPELAALFEIQSVPTTLFLNPKKDPVMTSGGLMKANMERAIAEVFGIT